MLFHGRPNLVSRLCVQQCSTVPVPVPVPSTIEGQPPVTSPLHSRTLLSRRWYTAPPVNINSGPAAGHVWPSNVHPTPYQIFNCAKGDAYSKGRYYELCMLYHPDRSCLGEDHIHRLLSDKVRNERFRLVVAANEVLSDPVRRRAYDQYGAGWNGRVGLERGAQVYRRRHAAAAAAAARGGSGGASQHPWWAKEAWTQQREGGEPPDPYRNATWEDWEKYHAWRDGTAAYSQRQKPIYMSNVAFMSMLFCLVTIGSILNISHTQESGKMHVADRAKLHEQISRDMYRRRKEAIELGDKGERVRNFLRNRDPYGQLNGGELLQEKYRRLLPLEQQQHPVLDGERAELAREMVVAKDTHEDRKKEQFAPR